MFEFLLPAPTQHRTRHVVIYSVNVIVCPHSPTFSMRNKDLNTSFQPDQGQYLVAQILKLRQRLILLKKEEKKGRRKRAVLVDRRTEVSGVRLGFKSQLFP